MGETALPANDNPAPPSHGERIPGHPGRPFAPGNKLGKGNPNNKRAQELRNAVVEAIGPENIKALLLKFLEMGLAGDVQAGREVLDRALGKPKQCVDVNAALEILKLYAKQADTEAV